MCRGVHALKPLTLHRIALRSQVEAGDGPHRVQFRLAIDKVLEIGGYFKMRNDLAQRTLRKILDRYDVGWIYGASHGITVT
jgi:hypothetical protein